MVQPITCNHDWLECLAGLPTWAPPLQSTTVLAPHPDDETLGAGALIHALTSRGARVTVVAATDGENAYDTPAERRMQLARVREWEQNAALARLGVQADRVRRLRLPDSGLLSCVERITQGILPLVDRETHLIAPWSGDFHPDHVACAEAAEAVRLATGCSLTSYFFWTWHRGTPDSVRGMDLRRFVPSEEDRNAKAEAIQAHSSQLHDEGEDGPILPANLLGPVTWPFEVYLPHPSGEAK